MIIFSCCKPWGTLSGSVMRESIFCDPPRRHISHFAPNQKQFDKHILQAHKDDVVLCQTEDEEERIRLLL
jgi:hypothetical protein